MINQYKNFKEIFTFKIYVIKKEKTKTQFNKIIIYIFKNKKINSIAKLKFQD